jgi:prevent-host-death family protein
MKTIGAAEFKAHCLQILDEVSEEEVVITKRGKPVARLVPYERRRDDSDLIGILKGRIKINPEDDLFSTGAWVSDEWGERNDGPA